MDQIKIDNLQVGYDKKIIIDDLSIQIPKGKITVIIGPNGCGKSTLLKSIARVLKINKGNIYVEGQNISSVSAKQMAKKVTFLPQTPITPDGLLVEELVAYGRFPYQKPLGGLQEEDRDIINWAIKEMSLDGLEKIAVSSLSGGQRQRTWLAMALAQKTETLLLDEPTTYLDITHQLEILSLLQRMNEKENSTIVLVLHELNHASRFADHIIGMHNGEVAFAGAPLDVINQDNLANIYGIQAEVQLDKTGSYPICVEFDFVKK